MPSIDLTNILGNPRFVDTNIMVTRSVQGVGQNGLATLTPTTNPFAGVIIPNKGRKIQRESGGERSLGQILVVTVYPLQEDDIVTWHGLDWTVSDVEDWTNYGFVQATCDQVEQSQT